MSDARIGERLISIRRLRMWNQGRLAEEAGLSPTTVSGIETGRISHPHLGTIRKLARALGVDPQVLLSPEKTAVKESVAPLSLKWARSVEEKEEEFEREIERAPLEALISLTRELRGERRRLQRLYGEFPEGSEQRRFIKRQIRAVSAQDGSVTTSVMFHKDEGAKAQMGGYAEADGEPQREGIRPATES